MGGCIRHLWSRSCVPETDDQLPPARFGFRRPEAARRGGPFELDDDTQGAPRLITRSDPRNDTGTVRKAKLAGEPGMGQINDDATRPIESEDLLRGRSSNVQRELGRA